MRKIALQIINQVKEKPRRIGEIADQLEKSESWISNVVSDLVGENLLENAGKVKLSNSYETSLLTGLMDTYDLEKVLSGKRERILKELTDGESVKELESKGFPKSTVYRILKDLKTMGVVKKEDKRYKIIDEDLKDFIKARKKSQKNRYTANGEKILISKDIEEEKGVLTAFSSFKKHGVEYYPAKTYLYKGEKEPTKEDVLIHAILSAENKKQMSMCAIFYLKNKDYLKPDKLWNLSKKWNCKDELADLLAYLDRRKTKSELFLPWKEFTNLAKDYGMSLRGEHPKQNLLTSLENIGKRLETDIDVYLLGGANLIFRTLKDTTKDVDIIVREGEELEVLKEALEKIGYEEKVQVERAYEELEPGTIMEKKGFPRWDVFVENVANCLNLSSNMIDRSEKFEKFGKLQINQISLTDIFLFKSVTDRAGDLEDAALIARTGKVDWDAVLEEIKEQEEITGKHLSFPVLDTLDLLSERDGIETPAEKELEDICLGKALILTLEQPKTIKDLRKELDFPEHQIYNKLRKLEDEGVIKVDRSKKLNLYQTQNSE